MIIEVQMNPLIVHSHIRHAPQGRRRHEVDLSPATYEPCVLRIDLNDIMGQEVGDIENDPRQRELPDIWWER